MNKLFFAQKAFIVANNELLVIQKSEDDPYQPGKWEVPGGRIDFGENTDEHLQREVREEVGLEVVPGRPFYIWQWILEKYQGGDDAQVVAVARLAETLSQKVSSERQVADDYINTITWVSLTELDQLDWIENLIPVVELFLSEVVGVALKQSGTN